MYKRDIIEHKEADGKTTLTTAPEVHDQVMKEVKALGENVKGQVDELNRSFTALKSTIDSHDGKLKDVLTEAKVAKLTEDILTRQEALEKGFKPVTSRMDDIEALVKRMATGKTAPEGDDDAELKRATKTFKLHQISMRKQMQNYKGGITVADQDVEDYRNYNKTFDKYLRLFDPQLNQLSPDDMKYLTVGSDPDGGILVTPAMSARIVERIWEMDPIRQLADIQVIGTDALEMLEDLDQILVDWETETTSTTQGTTPKLSRKRIPVHIQSARPLITQQMIDDASINIEEWLAKKTAEKMGRAEAEAFVTGNGMSRPRGFTTYGVYTGTAGDGGVNIGQIEQSATGKTGVLSTDGFLAVKYSLVEDLLNAGTWLMNRLTVAETMKLKDGDGQYIWRPGLQEGQPSLLLGLPLRMSKSMPLVTTGAIVAALADWKEAYTIVDRQGISVQRDPYTRKPFVEFYTRRRVGGDVVNFQAIKLLVVS